MRDNAINIKEDTNITLTRLGRKKNLISKTKCNEWTQLTVVTTKSAYTEVSLEELSESTIILQAVICSRQHHEI